MSDSLRLRPHDEQISTMLSETVPSATTRTSDSGPTVGLSYPVRFASRRLLCVVWWVNIARVILFGNFHLGWWKWLRWPLTFISLFHLSVTRMAAKLWGSEVLSTPDLQLRLEGTRILRHTLSIDDAKRIDRLITLIDAGGWLYSSAWIGFLIIGLVGVLNLWKQYGVRSAPPSRLRWFVAAMMACGYGAAGYAIWLTKRAL